MGANAGTAVPVYASGEVLTAARLNLTNCGVPVFSGTATRDAAFGGSGEKVLAEGQLAYLEDADVVQYYTGAAWATVGPATSGALVLIKSQTIGTAVSSVAVTDVFSATYDTYKIVIGEGVGSTALDLRFQLGASTASYYGGQFGTNYTNGAFAGRGVNNQANFLYAGYAAADGIYLNCEVSQPFIAKETQFSSFIGLNGGSNAFSMFVGYHAVAASYTGFTLLTSTGTLTGGTIRVYGYAK